MEIITNEIERDTVEWRATAINDLGLNKYSETSNKKIVNMYDLAGKKLSKPNINQVIIIEYEDGLIEKDSFLIIEDSTLS